MSSIPGPNHWMPAAPTPSVTAHTVSRLCHMTLGCKHTQTDNHWASGHICPLTEGTGKGREVPVLSLGQNGEEGD